MAIPTSARVSAGASFIPSPTMATFPCSMSFLITASFPSGSTPATTSSTPACSAIAFAVISLSPVSMTTWIPIFLSSLTACGVSSFMVSATAIIPISLLSFVKRTGVLPCAANLSRASLINASVLSRIPVINFAFPPATVSAPSFAFSPFPGKISNSVVSLSSISFSFA